VEAATASGAWGALYGAGSSSKAARAAGGMSGTRAFGLAHPRVGPWSHFFAAQIRTSVSHVR